VALLELLRRRADLSLTVVHLDHETRGGASGADAAFVRGLASRWSIPCIVARRSEVEAQMTALPQNRSARYRVARLAFFRRVVEDERLDGVVLAHQADDQAETVLQRLLRGSGPAGLTGMRRDAVVGGLRVLRPLLAERREALRELLRGRGIGWREDASNRSPDQQRNRVRALLAGRPELHHTLLELADASGALVSWLRGCGPALGERIDVAQLRNVPPPVAREAARRWLARRSGGEVSPAAAQRLVQMALDAASPPRQHFPGALLVRRRGGMIFVDDGS
jgi:tRNA(Ile)-lysidine synthase